MQAGDIELCQCTLNLLTFSISRFPALRGELLGEEIDNSAWLRDSVQDRTPVGNWKPPLCCCSFHSKVNNGWCHWSQGNWLLKLGLKTAKSVLPGTSWLQERLHWVCSQMSVGWKWGCAGGVLCPTDQPASWEGLLVGADVLFPVATWLPALSLSGPCRLSRGCSCSSASLGFWECHSCWCCPD